MKNRFPIISILFMLLVLAFVPSCRKKADPIPAVVTPPVVVTKSAAKEVLTFAFSALSPATLYTIDAALGSKKWETTPGVGNLILSGAVVAEGVVYIGIGSKLYAFEASTGVKKWEYATSCTIDQSSPCVLAKDGTVYHMSISDVVQ